MVEGVLVVDDHDVFRRAARRALEAGGWAVIGEASDGVGALEAARALEPAVVLLDVGLPDVSGLEVARELSSTMPELAVVLVSTHDRADFYDLALEAGARGFLAKSELSGDSLRSLVARSRGHRL